MKWSGTRSLLLLAYLSYAGLNQCGQYYCAQNATCTFQNCTHSCECNEGYSGDGFTCENINECEITSELCHSNATCTDTPGSYTCTCNPGFEGDGIVCNEINECSSSPCRNRGTCTDQVNGYLCTCAVGYVGANCETYKICDDQWYQDCDADPVITPISNDPVVDSANQDCSNPDSSVSFKITRGSSGDTETDCPLCGQPGDVIYTTTISTCHGKAKIISP